MPDQPTNLSISKLKRILSPVETWLYGLGNLSSWILLAPFFYSQFGSGAIYGLVFLSALVFLQVFHVDRLAKLFPNRTGGASGYLLKLFPDLPKTASYFALGSYFVYLGAFAWIGYVILDVISSTFAVRATGGQAILWVLFFSLVGYVITVASTKAIITIQNIFLIPFLVILPLFTVLGLWRIFTGDTLTILPSSLPTLSPLIAIFLVSAGLSNVLTFDSLGATASEATNPGQTLRLSRYIGGISAFVYVLATWVLFRLSSGDATESLFVTLNFAFGQVFGEVGKYLVLVLIVFSGISATAKGIYMVSRIFYQLGEDGFLHGSFNQLDERGTAVNSLVFSAVLTVPFVFLGGIESLYVTIGTCWAMTYAALNIGVYRQRNRFTSRLLPRTSLLVGLIEIAAVLVSGVLSDWRFVVLGLCLPLVPLALSRILARIPPRRRDFPRVLVFSKTQFEYNQILATELIVLLVVGCASFGLFAFTALTSEFIISFAILLFGIMSLFAVALASVTVFPSIEAIRRAEQKTQSLNTLLQADIARRQKVEHKLKLLTRQDSLTKLKNRTAISEIVNAYLQQKNPRFALIFLDLDRFKLINDSLGHLIGDKLLVAVSKRLKKLIRRPNVLARLGGDEYVVFLPHLEHTRKGLETVQKLLNAFKDPYEVDKKILTTTASIGLVFGDERYDKFIDVVRDADIAMYESKRRGRNRYTVFTDLMKDHVLVQQKTEDRLRRALSEDKVQIYYQPIVEARSTRMQGFEVLTRLRYGSTLVSPADFIPVANESGLILPLTWVVIEKTCRYLAILNKPHLYASINVSDSFLTQLDLKAKLQRILAQNEIRPEQLHIEILESATLTEQGLVRQNVRLLERMGVKLVIDDFGTGYSNLSRLEDIPLSALKIDMSFLRGLEREKNLNIYKAIVELAEALELECVAEGVETSAQYQLVRTLGVDAVQGYYFARPKPIEQLKDSLPQLHQK